MARLARDIAIEDVLAAAPPLMERTEQVYATYLRKFAQFVEVGPANATGIIDKQYYTDESIAKFVFEQGNQSSHKPHVLKGCLAAIGSALLKLELPGIFAMPHVYTKTNLVVKVFWII